MAMLQFELRTRALRIGFGRMKAEKSVEID